LDVRCEEDLVAKKYWGATHCETISADFTLDLFRKIVLPRLKEEVNEGEHFSEARRMYSAGILATWLKKNQQNIKNEKIRKLVDCGDATTKFPIRGVTPLRTDKATVEQSVAEKKAEARPVEHATPNAPAFKVPENVECYEQYIRLFKDGVFRCARSEASDAPDERVIRVYFSGAVDFRNLSDLIRRVQM
jgi:hypothetical protein